MNLIGETAAFATAICWSISAIGFSISGKQIGSQSVNRIRVLIAFLLLVIVNWIFYKQPIPISASPDRWFWLLLSGFIGLAIGDAFLFKTYQLLGARMGLLFLSLAPVFSALFAWWFMGELLNLMQFAGMLLTLLGIGWVVFARQNDTDENEDPKDKKLGVLFGVLAAIGQAVGLILSRQGMGGNFSPISGTLIRMIAAVLALWVLAIIQKKAIPTLVTAFENKNATSWITLGSVFGPVIGVSLSLLAIQHAKIGVVSTIIALPPVLILPVSYFVFKERFGWQAIAGTLVSMAGVALLFMK
jgi:drug/metabolite transporter (DMT)-like permease